MKLVGSGSKFSVFAVSVAPLKGKAPSRPLASVWQTFSSETQVDGEVAWMETVSGRLSR